METHQRRQRREDMADAEVDYRRARPLRHRSVLSAQHAVAYSRHHADKGRGRNDCTVAWTCVAQSAVWTRGVAVPEKDGKSFRGGGVICIWQNRHKGMARMDISSRTFYSVHAWTSQVLTHRRNRGAVCDSTIRSRLVFRDGYHCSCE